MLSFLLPLLQCNRIPEERRYTLPLKSVYMKQIDHMVGLFWIRRCQQHKQGFSTHLPQVQMQWDSKGSTAGQTLVAQVLVSKGKLKLTWISSSMSGCIKSGSWEALLLGNWQSSRELFFFFFLLCWEASVYWAIGSVTSVCMLCVSVCVCMFSITAELLIPVLWEQCHLDSHVNAKIYRHILWVSLHRMTSASLQLIHMIMTMIFKTQGLHINRKRQFKVPSVFLCLFWMLHGASVVHNIVKYFLRLLDDIAQ